MKLGELSWELGLEDPEKDRLSKAVSNASHVAHDVLRDYVRKTRFFGDVAKQLQKRIPGFRPKSEGYNQRAASIIIQDLGSNKAPLQGWVVYRQAVALYFEKEFEKMWALMQEAEVEWDSEQFDAAATATLFVNSVCEAADQFGVIDTDVQLLYELWPIERQDNIEELIEACPKYDPIRDLERKIQKVQDDLLRVESSGHLLVEESLESQLGVSAVRDLLAKSEDKIQSQFDRSLSEKIDALANSIDVFKELQ